MSIACSTTRGRLRLLPSLVRVAFAIVALCAMPSPAPATPGFGADLGVPSGLRILDSTSCGQYMTTATLDSECDSANAHHWIVLGWNFNPHACSAPPCAAPDGFNIVKSSGGARSTFATQVASAGQTTVFGTILQNIKGDENIGACFSVVPYRGTNDVGRASNEVCIEEVMHLGPARWGTTHSTYYFDGSACSSPTSNPVGYGLMFRPNGANSGKEIFAGYVERSNDNCNRYDDFYQGLIYYDFGNLAGKTVTKATLKLQVVEGATNAGYDGPASGGTDGSEKRVDINCVSGVGSANNVNVGRDPAFPKIATFDHATTVNGGIGEVDVDVTAIVRMWLAPGGVNRGIVLSPPYLSAGDITHLNVPNNGYVLNRDCLSQYREPVLDVDLH